MYLRTWEIASECPHEVNFPSVGLGDELDGSRDTLLLFSPWDQMCSPVRWPARNRDGWGTEEQGDTHSLVRKGGFSLSCTNVPGC